MTRCTGTKCRPSGSVYRPRMYKTSASCGRPSKRKTSGIGIEDTLLVGFEIPVSACPRKQKKKHDYLHFYGWRVQIKFHFRDVLNRLSLLSSSSYLACTLATTVGYSIRKAVALVGQPHIWCVLLEKGSRTSMRAAYVFSALDCSRVPRNSRARRPGTIFFVLPLSSSTCRYTDIDFFRFVSCFHFPVR